MKIFLSYPRENIDIAEEIYDFLIQFDIDVWFDKKVLIPGQDWDQERLNGQKNSEQMILVYSIYTKEKSGVIQREIKDALDIIRDKPPQSQYLLPIKVGNISVPSEISRFQYIEYGDLNWKSYLISAIKTYAAKNNIALSEKFFRSEETLRSKITILNKEYNFEHSSFSARYISYNKKSEYFCYVNAKIISIIYDEYFSFIKFGDDFLEEYSLSGYRNIYLEEYFSFEESISLVFKFDWYGAGAAHPNSHTLTLNFKNSKEGCFSIYDLFNMNEETVSYLIKYSKDVLIDLLCEEHGDIDFFDFSPENPDSKKEFERFKFDKVGITFIFDPYAILPYIYGPQEVHLPWSRCKRFLNKEFIKNWIIES